jgi:hypothetical protein
MNNQKPIDLKNRKKIAGLLRLLSSDHQGEVLSAVAALRRTCSLNELGDIIESGKGSLSEDDMKKLFDSGFHDGYDAGFNKGLTKGKEFIGKEKYNNNNSSEIYGSPSEDSKKVLYCQKHKNILKSKERKFIEDMVNWTVAFGKSLTSAQRSWLEDIYHRLMASGYK